MMIKPFIGKHPLIWNIQHWNLGHKWGHHDTGEQWDPAEMGQQTTTLSLSLRTPHQTHKYVPAVWKLFCHQRNQLYRILIIMNPVDNILAQVEILDSCWWETCDEECLVAGKTRTLPWHWLPLSRLLNQLNTGKYFPIVRWYVGLFLVADTGCPISHSYYRVI